MSRAVKALEEKPKIEKEIRNGLKIQEELTAMESSFDMDKNEVETAMGDLNKAMEAQKVKADNTLRALNEALEKAKQELINEEEKLKQDMKDTKDKLETMKTDHLAELERRKRDEKYRSDMALKNLAKKLEHINVSMKTLRDIVIDDLAGLDED